MEGERKKLRHLRGVVACCCARSTSRGIFFSSFFSFFLFERERERGFRDP